MPKAKHRRHGKSRPRSRTRSQDATGTGLSPELAAEMELLHEFLCQRHGDRRPTHAELEDALSALSDRLPLSNRLVRTLDDDPDGTLASVLLAAARG